MSFQRIIPTILLGLLPLGCMSAPAPIDEAERTGEDLAQLGSMRLYPLSTNGLKPGLLVDQANLDALSALADGPLSASTPLADTDGGRTLLSYVARCALARGDLFQSTDKTGQVYGFQGNIGLTPDWASGAIDASSRRWISACLLAHANAYGRSVDIFLVGAHRALDAHPPADFNAQEAGFYGDVFQGSGKAPDLFACVGSSESSATGTPPRVCGRTSDCGFSIVGRCGAPAPDPVCDGGPDVYNYCATSTVDAQAPALSEVITVYSRPGTFVGGSTECSHDPKDEGAPLAAECSDCTARVCDTDPYCCATDWDEACVAAMDGLCSP